MKSLRPSPGARAGSQRVPYLAPVPTSEPPFDDELPPQSRVARQPTSEARFRPANEALTAPEPGQARVVFIGDSRIDMWESLPNVPDCQMVNRGCSAETTTQLRLRLQRDAIQLKPEVVVIETGLP